MLNIPPSQKIDVEEFKRLLLSQRSTTSRFRLQLTYDQAVSAITAAYMAEVEYRHRRYISDVYTAQHIQDAARWLTDPCPKFGMLLCGQCGNGKSTLVLAIRSLIQLLFRSSNYDDQRYLRIVDAKEVVATAKADYRQFTDLCRADMLAIDDLGIEPSEVLDYGNVLNPAIDLLTRRYNDQLFTIVTTNLTPKQIREHYGDRIADRFNEMMARIVFNNPSYRNAP